jgi:hypothetical protein
MAIVFACLKTLFFLYLNLQLMLSNHDKKEKALTNLINALDKITQDLEKLPTVFAREEKFAQQFDL